MAVRGETVELDLFLVRQSEKAYLVRASDDPDTEQWVPKSQVEVDRAVNGQVCQFVFPTWLAEDRDLA